MIAAFLKIQLAFDSQLKFFNLREFADWSITLLFHDTWFIVLVRGHFYFQ
jgi:hypothetical protein